MIAKKTNGPRGKDDDNSQSNPAAGSSRAENTRAAHKQADQDISNDPDLSIQNPNDDLDEGESARLGEDKTDLV